MTEEMLNKPFGLYYNSTAKECIVYDGGSTMYSIEPIHFTLTNTINVAILMRTETRWQWSMDSGYKLVGIDRDLYYIII